MARVEQACGDKDLHGHEHDERELVLLVEPARDVPMRREGPARASGREFVDAARCGAAQCGGGLWCVVTIHTHKACTAMHRQVEGVGVGCLLYNGTSFEPESAIANTPK